VRHYTYGADLARGIRLCVESAAATNEDFNLSTAQSTTVADLAQVIWRKAPGNHNGPLRLVHDPPYPYDVPRRVPDVRKAASLLGFTATTTLDQMLDEVIPWIAHEMSVGRI
jgi:nucleoside-diphosphate-sugar epimerase